jgi:hypothetical protein
VHQTTPAVPEYGNKERSIVFVFECDQIATGTILSLSGDCLLLAIVSSVGGAAALLVQRTRGKNVSFDFAQIDESNKGPACCRVIQPTGTDDGDVGRHLQVICNWPEECCYSNLGDVESVD